MSDNPGTGDQIEEQIRIAHSGGLARWARMCARHPWRVVASWSGRFVADRAECRLPRHAHERVQGPGTDFQKATDLINAKFGARRARRCGSWWPPRTGERLDTPERQAASSKMVAAGAGRRRRRRPERRRTSRHDRRPAGAELAPALQERADRLLRRPVRPDRVRAAARRASSTSRTSCGDRRAGRASRSSSPARPRARRRRALSTCSACSPAFIILLMLFRALVPTVIPLLFAIAAVIDGVPAALPGRPVHQLQHDHRMLVPMIGLGVGIDYTLFIVTRFRQMLHDGLARRRPRRRPARPPAGP